jgi:hypothetical protein
MGVGIGSRCDKSLTSVLRFLALIERGSLLTKSVWPFTGWIPSMFPYGFIETFTSTLDFPNLWRTISLATRYMFEQLLLGKF